MTHTGVCRISTGVVGPSATSQYDGRRYSNIPSLAEWCSWIKRKQPNRVDQVELTPEVLATDSLIFGLRMNSGVDLCALHCRFPTFDLTPLWPLWGELGNQGLVEGSKNSRLRLTQKGRFLADRIAVEIIDVFARVKK